MALYFAAGQRPDIRALDLLAGTGQTSTGDEALPGTGASPGAGASLGRGASPDRSASPAISGASAFTVAHRSAPAEGWAELLSQGLAYDCRGLAPAAAEPVVRPTAFFGVSQALPLAELEPITLTPGPHLTGAEGLAPVYRTLAGLAARLAALPGLAALGWEPARSLMAPAYFVRIVTAWLEGGAFPALGLTSLERTGDGALCSQGLAFFTGQEVIVEGASGRSMADLARIAVRLAHEMVQGEPIEQARSLVGPGGEALRAVPEDRGRIVRVSWV